MLASPPALLMALFLLVGSALAQPAAASSCRPGVRHLEVSAETSEEAHPVCISPEQSTVFSFDAKLAPGSVSLEGADGFILVEPSSSMLKLVPSEKVPLGRPLRLSVRFADNAAPSSATFLLVAHAAQAEPLVDVHRQTRTVASYKQELRAKEEEARQLREENARLRADKAGPGGLTGLLLSGAMGEDGVASSNLSRSATHPPTNALTVGRLTGYRSVNRVALALSLLTPAGAPAWTVEGAALTLEGKRDGPLKVLWVWQDANLSPGQQQRVLVEAASPPDAARGPYTLKLWNAGGTRTMTLGGIIFP